MSNSKTTAEAAVAEVAAVSEASNLQPPTIDTAINADQTASTSHSTPSLSSSSSSPNSQYLPPDADNPICLASHHLQLAGVAPSSPLGCYVRALTSRDVKLFSAGFSSDVGVYAGFWSWLELSERKRQRRVAHYRYMHQPPWQRREEERQQQEQLETENEVSGELLSAPFSSLLHCMPHARFIIHSLILSHDGSRAVLEYDLMGEWSGRLPSMPVGVYDRPLKLRCIDVIRMDASKDGLLRRVDVHMDRYEFLVQLGMVTAKL